MQQLDQYVADLRRVSPELSFSVLDVHGVTIRQVRAQAAAAVPEERWHRFDVAIHNMVYGYLYTSIPLKEVMDEITQSLYSLRLALLLTELSEWAATEAQRRGEKVQKVLMEGVTAENAHLLSLCGLQPHPGYTVVAMELHEPEHKFQRMELLRSFMVANIWRYQGEFPFFGLPSQWDSRHLCRCGPARVDRDVARMDESMGGLPIPDFQETLAHPIVCNHGS